MRTKKYSPFLIGLICLSTLSVFSCSQEPPETAEEATMENTTVQVIEAERREEPISITYAGTLEPWTEVNLGGNITGTIEQLHVEEGDEFEEGELLVQLEDDQLRQARLNAELARREYERLQPLQEEGSVTGREVDQAQTEYQNRLIEVATLEENTQLAAPFDGVVSEKFYEEGEFYTASPTGQGGAPGVLHLMRQNPLKLIIDVNETYLQDLQEGDQVNVRLDAFPGEAFESTIYKILPTIDVSTRTFEIEVEIPNEEQRLRPGLFARATIALRETEGLFIPREALLRGTSANAEDHVYTVNESGSVNRQPVQIGNFVDEDVIIESGLEAGQQVIIQGKQAVENGMQVNYELRQIN